MPLSSRQLKQLQAFYNRLHTVEVLYQAKTQIGGSLFFEPETNQLIWTDHHSNEINFLNVDNCENRSITLPDKVGAVIPLEWSTNLLAATARKLCIVDRETGAILEEVASVEDDKPGNRFNDAKCDANGRLWAATTGPDSRLMSTGLWGSDLQQGSLYSCNLGTITQCVPELSVSTGLGWNHDSTTMYHINTSGYTRHLYASDYNIVDGSITNRRLFIDFTNTCIFPYAICTDTEGRLWITCTNGVTCYDPIHGEILVHAATPKSGFVTSCCFGGPDHSWLYVICARSSVADYVDYCNAGAIFVFKDLGAKGRPANRFKYVR